VAANVVHAPTCFIRAASSNLRCGSSHNIRVIDGGIAEARPFYWDAAEIVAACAALDGQARDVHPQQTEGQRVVVGDLANRRDAGRLRCSFQLGCRRIGAVQNELEAGRLSGKCGDPGPEECGISRKTYIMAGVAMLT
jgi:hypothetical protein